MQICAIKNSETKNINIPAATAIGGAAGLAIRQFLPVYKEEIDTVMFNQSDEFIKNNVKKERLAFIKEVNNKAKKVYKEGCVDEFLLFLSKPKDKILENVPEKVKENYEKLKISFEQRLKAAETLTEANIKSAVKQARPVWAYLLPAAALSAMGAFVYNVVGTIAKED